MGFRSVQILCEMLVHCVEATLARLMDREPEPMVKRLAKQPGTKESRYAHLFGGDVPDVWAGAVEHTLERRVASASDDRVATLEEEVRQLQQEVSELRAQFADFRKQFD